MIRLHYYPGNASMTPHALLYELALPFELQLVDREREAQRAPEYLKLNPNGLIPVLVDGDLVLYETAAIVLHLVDTHPKADLAPALGTSERAHFYKWLMWMTNTLQTTLMIHFYPERWVSPDNSEGAAEVKRQAQLRTGGLLDQLETQLTSHGGGWLLADAFSALDPYAFMLCRWTRAFDAGIAAPARVRPALGAYLQRVLARPSVQRMLEVEQLAAPWV